jgi:hypothetical protein
MSTSTARVAVFVACFWSGIATAQLGQTTPYNSYPVQSPLPYGPYTGQPVPGQQTPKNPLLLALIVQPLLQQSGGAMASGVGRLFTRLFDALLGRSGGAATAPTPNMPGAPGYVAGMPATYGQTYPYSAAYPGATYPSGMPATVGSYPGGIMGTYPSATTGTPTPTYGMPTYGTQTPGVYPSATTGTYSLPYASTSPPGYPPGTPAYSTGTTTGYPAATANTGMPPNTSTATNMPGIPPGTTPSSSAPYTPGMSTMPAPGATVGGATPTPTGAMPSMPMPASPGAAASPGTTMAGTAAYPYATASTSATPGVPIGTGGSPGLPPVSPTPTGPKALVLPSVVYSLDALDPKKFTTTRHVKISTGSAPTLHTGDVFAIEYSTNLPGQLRIDNIDSAGRTAELGTYIMLPGRDNRIPITKGIKLVGETGTETFKMYFFPCVPESQATTASASGSVEGLPACPMGPSPQLLKASQQHLGAKGAINLESPDPTIAVAAVTDYQSNDVMASEFRINHIAPDSSPSTH